MVENDQSAEGRKDTQGISAGKPFEEATAELYRKTKDGNGPAFAPSPDPASLETVSGAGAYVPEQLAGPVMALAEELENAESTDLPDHAKLAYRICARRLRSLIATITEVKPHPHGHREVKGGETVGERVARVLEALTETGALAELRSDDPRFLPAAEVLASEFFALGIDPPSAWSDGFRAGQNDAVEFSWKWQKRNRQLTMALSRLLVDYESACTSSSFDTRWMLKRMAIAQINLNFWAAAPTPLVDPDAPSVEQRNAQVESALANANSMLLRIAETAGGEDQQIIQTRDGFDIASVALETVERLRTAYVATGQLFPPLSVTEAQTEGGQ